MPPPDGNNVGPDGGTVESADGKVRLTIPAGALSAPTEITIEPIALADLDAAFDDFVVEDAYEFGPDGLEFDAPIEVAFLSSQAVDGDSFDFEFLLTLEDGAATALDALTTVVDRQDGSIWALGETTLFTPIVRFARFESLLSEGVHSVGTEVSFEDIPLAPVEVPMTFTVSATAVSETLELFADGGAGAPAAGFQTYPPPYLSQVGVGEFTRLTEPLNAVVTSRCDMPGSGERGAWRLSFYANDTVRPFLLGDALLHAEVGEGIACVEGDPVLTLTPGVFAFNILSNPEAVYILGQVFAYLDAVNRLLAVFTGAQGSIIVDLGTQTVLDDRTDPEADPDAVGRFGMAGISRPNPGPKTPAALFEFKYAGSFPEFGGALTNYDVESETFFNGVSISQGAHYDATLVGRDGSQTAVADELLAATDRGLSIIAYDADAELYGDAESIASSAFGNHALVSAFGLVTGGPVLALTLGTPRSVLYYTDRIAEPVALEVAELDTVIGNDARRIRCVGGLCAVSLYGDDSLRFLEWDGDTQPTWFSEPVTVGDGPVGIDGYALPNGNTLFGSTGSIDNSYSLTEVDPMGVIVSNDSYPVDEACLAPSHFQFVMADTLYGLVSCFDSDNYQIIGLSISF
ncbi:MAG: hypothetical protein K0U79_11335 [Gammaproteobacteria bacterium]|nr:hypothetical protein [Gammaproteobacteria bacterium]